MQQNIGRFDDVLGVVTAQRGEEFRVRGHGKPRPPASEVEPDVVHAA